MACWFAGAVFSSLFCTVRQRGNSGGELRVSVENAVDYQEGKVHFIWMLHSNPEGLESYLFMDLCEVQAVMAWADRFPTWTCVAESGFPRGGVGMIGPSGQWVHPGLADRSGFLILLMLLRFSDQQLVGLLFLPLQFAF